MARRLDAQPRVDACPTCSAWLRLAGVPALPLAGARPRGRRLGARRADALGRHRLPRRLPRPQAQPDLARSGRSSTRSPTGSTSSPSSIGLALRDIIPWWVALSLPLRDLLLWGLVPFLRTRGYSALPVHFLGKAATFNLLYAFPLLLLGDGDGHRRDAGRGLRLGVRDLGDRPLLVGRASSTPGRCASCSRDHRATCGGGRWLTPATATAARPRHDAAADPDHRSSRSTRTTRHVAAARAAPGDAARRGPAAATGRRRPWSSRSGCWSPSPAVQTSRTPASTTRAGQR